MFKSEIINVCHLIVQYYKSNKVANSKILLSHITLASITASDVVLMPCHVSSHWTLLVCRQKEQCWDFYDSFKSGRHRSNLPDLVKTLYEEVSEALPADIIMWPINEVPNLPQQDNGDDCGVFVMKFMKEALSAETISWQEKKNWCKEMPQFHAEITADILRAFSNIINTNISA
ncbi:putative ubiquitin-like-specific protease 1B [Platanthera guangdongensis]|uniref:Ubiquitin-like-specific protease 1B n=2 Tax=Platanthera guangdongensis TaxID=2320717 RepID=A0ABR2MPA5_9ASPA